LGGHSEIGFAGTGPDWVSRFNRESGLNLIADPHVIQYDKQRPPPINNEMIQLGFALQKAHPNPAHGRNAEEENHMLTKDLIAAVMATAEKGGTKFDWVNCGMCVDERGADQAIPGVRRGSPADLLKMAQESDNTLVIGTR